ncbi:MAG: AhpC/TSA family protein [Armatimonadetes bacterium]|nr:AhpC/TSA family protein [Armatimonadota bacterium]
MLGLASLLLAVSGCRKAPPPSQAPGGPPAAQPAGEPATLGEALKARRDASKQRMPAEVRGVMEKAQSDLAASEIIERSLKVGAAMPSFKLPDATGKKVNSADLLRSGPLVVTFYRGGWCPYCNTALHYLQKELPKFQAAGTTLVAISPQLPDKSLSLAEKQALTFPVLTDAGNRVARKFGIVFELAPELRERYKGFGADLSQWNGDSSYTLPLPATYVVDRLGILRWRFVDTDYTKRAEPADVLSALAALPAGTTDKSAATP